MKILGLSLGELSTAALFIDDGIIACVSEERFSKKKNDEAYPKQSIEYVLDAGGIAGDDLDAVVIAGNVLNLSTHLVRTYSSWNVFDQVRLMKEFWYPVIYENKKVDFYEIFKDKIDTEQYPGNWDDLLSNLSGYFSEDDWPRYRMFLHKTISDHIGVPIERIKHIDHHTCHAAYAYWASPFRGNDVMIMTADAYGDGLSATLSIPDGNNRIKRVHAVSHQNFTLARLYRYTTLILGMKANEHEYKVMGLAPYAKEDVLKPAYDVFRKHMYVEGIEFKFHNKPRDYYFWFKDLLEGVRFDGIAGGLQRYTEEIMLEFTRNAMQRYGTRRLVYSGGISMNIKSNMLLKDMPEIDDMSVPPSGGDESLAIGACYAFINMQSDQYEIRPLKDSYLGPDVDSYDVDIVVRKAVEDGYFIYDADNEFIADLLTRGLIIGRCCGRMEFGARALGNRSIIADPRKRSIVDIINRKIKNRDFWMPFAPSVLEDYFDKYAVNPKGISSPFMTIGFESTEEGKKLLEAATHPADKTLRPQVVNSRSNPEYYSLIKSFYTKTGVGGLLNTSFNLHGEPIVNTPQDAYRVFRLTDIDALILEDKVISKTEL
jgi:carbamoyltransferase